MWHSWWREKDPDRSSLHVRTVQSYLNPFLCFRWADHTLTRVFPIHIAEDRNSYTLFMEWDEAALFFICQKVPSRNCGEIDVPLEQLYNSLSLSTISIALWSDQHHRFQPSPLVSHITLGIKIGRSNFQMLCMLSRDYDFASKRPEAGAVH